MKSTRNIFVILFIFISIAVFGQNYGNQSRFSFCKHTHETIALKELQQCKTLMPKNKNVEIKSYVISIYIKDETDTASVNSIDETSGLFRDFTITGNLLSKEVLDFLKQKLEEKEHLKIEVTEIVAIENNKEGKYDGFVFYLH